MVCLPLLAIIYKEREHAGKPNNKKAFEYVDVHVVVVVVAAGHGARSVGIIFVVGGMVIRMGIFKKIGYPFTERPFFSDFWSLLALYKMKEMKDEVTWFRLNGVYFPICNGIPETSYSKFYKTQLDRQI